MRITRDRDVNHTECLRSGGIGGGRENKYMHVNECSQQCAAIHKHKKRMLKNIPQVILKKEYSAECA